MPPISIFTPNPRNKNCRAYLAKLIVHLAIGLSLIGSASAEECQRKGKSIHSLSLSSGFANPRIRTEVRAPVESALLAESLQSNFNRAPEATVAWLLQQPGVGSEALQSSQGQNLLQTYFLSLTRSRTVAGALADPALRTQFVQLGQNQGLLGFLTSLSSAEQTSLATTLGGLDNASLQEVGQQLSAATATAVSSVSQNIHGDPALLQAFVSSILHPDNQVAAGIVTSLVQWPAFSQILLTQPDIATSLFAQAGGLNVLGDVPSTYNLGGQIDWDPERRRQLSLDYGLDVTPWFTWEVGYRYFGTQDGSRRPSPYGLNNSLDLARPNLRQNQLETAFNFGCYFDVWRPNIVFGLGLTHTNFRAQDQVLGKIDYTNLGVAYFIELGLDVDLSTYIEFNLGFRWNFAPENHQSLRNQLRLSPPDNAQKITLDNANIDIYQDISVLDLYLGFRFFL